MNDLSEAGRRGKSLRWELPIVFLSATLALAPTTGDIGLTWDEPSYRYSQIMSEHWWRDLFASRSLDDLARVMDKDALLYYWPYGRYGINFHPPLAGQLNLLTYELFGGFLKDITARRMSSVFEFALTVTILYGFLATRYGRAVGVISASALLLMPRVYGDAHIAGTDTPGLLLWAATATAFWKGINEPNSRKYRVLVGILIGLSFVEKTGAVVVLLPMFVWLAIDRSRGLLAGKLRRGDWLDGVLTTGLMLLPLALAYFEIRRLGEEFLSYQRPLVSNLDDVTPARTDLFTEHPAPRLPAAILIAPLLVWIARRAIGRLLPKSPWGAERPAIESWTAVLAFGPAVAWIGNPAWWRETLPRLAHYYQINTSRRGVLPDIQILYFGQTYEYSLPWHNAFALAAITTPALILLFSLVGVFSRTFTRRRDKLAAYFLLHMLALPVLRMLPTPAHDGVRLFLPSFFFLAAFCGFGIVDLSEALGKSRAVRLRLALSILTLGSAAWQLIRIHPYELSYYNELIGGPRGAWRSGFELSYWYEAFDDRTVAAINEALPDGSAIDLLNDMTNPPTFSTLQELGVLKKTTTLGSPDPLSFPHVWILTQDSKASAFTRLLFAMKPLIEFRPRPLDGARVVTVSDPVTVSRAWALQLLSDVDAGRVAPVDPPAAPSWVRSNAFLKPFGRFWGDGVTKAKPLLINEPMFVSVSTDPDALRAAAKDVADSRGRPSTPAGARLLAVMEHSGRWKHRVDALLRIRPEALLEAAEILIKRPGDVRGVLQRYSYTDPDDLGGFLDREFSGKSVSAR